MKPITHISLLWQEARSGKHSNLREAIFAIMPETRTVRALRMRGRRGR